MKYELVDMIRRLIVSLKEDTGKLSTTDYVAYLKFDFIDPNIIHMRGDFRYGSGEMAEKIMNGFDLVPIQVGKINNNYFVLNGHHRIRAYKEANKNIPAFIGWIEKSEDEKGFLIFID